MQTEQWGAKKAEAYKKFSRALLELSQKKMNDRRQPSPSLDSVSFYSTNYELPNDSMSRRSTLLTQIQKQNKPVHTSQTKKVKFCS